MASPLERPPSSQEAFDDAIELLRSDRERGFSIEIETDSMVFEDQKAERAARIEFITAVSNFLREAIPASTLYPAAAPILVELLMFGVRGFKAGRQLAEVFDEAAERMGEMKPAQGQQQGPSPEQIKAQEQQRAASEKAQADAQRAQVEMAKAMAEKAKHEAEIAKTSSDAMLKQQETQLAYERAVMKEEADKKFQLDMARMKMLHDEKLAREKLARDRELDQRKLAKEEQDLNLKVAAHNRQIIETQEMEAQGEEPKINDAINSMADVVAGVQERSEANQAAMVDQITRAMNTPKDVIFNEEGRPVGTRPAVEPPEQAV